MNLGIEVVEGSNLVALGEQQVRQVRADEARAACDEYSQRSSGPST
jgi:hypothetical protein